MAFDMYVWAKRNAEETVRQLNVDPGRSLSAAIKLANTLVQLAKLRDHRRDFFFAPGEESSPIR